MHDVTRAEVTARTGSGAAGGVNGTGSSASFNRPYGLARMIDGSMIVTDYDAHRIRQVQPGGAVSTLAGSGSAGSADGAAGTATFTNPTSLAVDDGAGLVELPVLIE